MIEVYSFLAVFVVQILVMSVVYPIRFARLMRAGLARVPAERLAAICNVQTGMKMRWATGSSRSFSCRTFQSS
jgi:predicted ABC-type exoprotein transport system permease subunit